MLGRDVYQITFILLNYKGRRYNIDVILIKKNIMMFIQMLSDVPDWARKRGLDDNTFDLLEQMVVHPDRKDEILRNAEYGTRCCLQNAYEYGVSKGLL